MRHEPIQQFEAAQPRASRVDVTIVMPCLNEVQCLAHCIANAQEALRQIANRYGLSGEILVADNGSTDGSQALATRLGARVVPIAERGYGAALIGGGKAAHGDYVVMGDADGSYDFIDGVAMIGALIDGAELCMGSRFKGGISAGAMPWKNRYIGNPVLTGLLNLFFRPGISDAHSGLRAIRKEAFLDLGLSGSGMEFASEMVIKAALKRLRIAETPVKLLPDLRDRAPHLRPWRDGWRHLRYLFMLSPTWVFGVPGIAALAAGMFILAVAILRSVGLTGPTPFGESWIVVGALLATVGHMAGLMAVASHLYGVRAGYRLPKSWLRRERHLLTLEACVIAGLTLVAGSICAMGAVGYYWGAGSFAALSSILPVALAGVMGTIGLQTMFGGFLLAVIGGNEATFAQAASTPPAPIDTPARAERRIPAASASGKLLGEAARFGITGLISVASNTLLIVLLTEVFKFHYVASYLFVFVAATLIGFFLNRSWSFRVTHGNLPKHLVRYAFFTIATLIVAVTALRLLEAFLGNYVAPVAVISAVLAPVNFFVHRTWSFGQDLGRDG